MRLYTSLDKLFRSLVTIRQGMTLVSQVDGMLRWFSPTFKSIPVEIQLFQRHQLPQLFGYRPCTVKKDVGRNVFYTYIAKIPTSPRKCLYGVRAVSFRNGFTVWSAPKYEHITEVGGGIDLKTPPLLS